MRMHNRRRERSTCRDVMVDSCGRVAASDHLSPLLYDVFVSNLNEDMLAANFRLRSRKG